MKGIKLRCPERMWRNFQSRIVWVFSPQRMASRNFFLKRSMRRPRRAYRSQSSIDSRRKVGPFRLSEPCSMAGRVWPCKAPCQPYNLGYEFAGVAQLVEHDVANVVVVGSN